MSDTKEKPILYNTEMVKAVLAGRKTQTRRVVKHDHPHFGSVEKFNHVQGVIWEAIFNDGSGINLSCPYGQVGDRLWVRETTCIAPKNWATPDDTCIPDKDGDLRYVSYKADGYPEDAMRDYGLKWTPSIHVPKWASRINLEITNIRVERVQDISEEDALAEGIERSEWEYNCEPYRNYKEPKMSPGKNKSLPSASFYTLWDSINEKRGYGWSVNPWVWVVEFKVI